MILPKYQKRIKKHLNFSLNSPKFHILPNFFFFHSLAHDFKLFCTAREKKKLLSLKLHSTSVLRVRSVFQLKLKLTAVRGDHDFAVS